MIVRKSIALLIMLPAAIMSVGQLPLPTVPDSLTTTQARADFVALHFYDAMDWSDPKMSADDAQTQAWADFLSILPYTSSGNDSAAISRLFSSIPAGFIPLYDELAEAYLLSADSEFTSERLYVQTLNSILSRPDLSATDRAFHKAHLEYLNLNAPGSAATDFTFTTSDGTTARLSDFVGKTPYLLIVFHDPDCDVCHNLLATLDTDHEWQSLKSEGTLAIITPEITDELEETFRMLYTPSLYLLDSSGHVIVRNVLLDKISAYINR